MSWFDIIKDAKEEAEVFFYEFREALFKQITSVLEEIDKDEKRLDESEKTHEAILASLSDIEREIMSPLINRQRDDRDETREQLNFTRTVLNKQLEEMKGIFEQVQDAPIEGKLVLLREHFADTPGFDGEPILDLKTLDEIIHNLGFEGKGLE